MRKWYELGPFTVFDVETTGMSPAKDRVVEIAAIKVGLDGLQQRFQSLVNPGSPIPPGARRVHGITDEMVAEAEDFSAVALSFADFIQDTTLVAHNARFDLGFLQESLFRSGLPVWDGKTMDSIPLLKNAFPGLPSYRLAYLRQRFALGDGFGRAHRAMSDVEWTLEVFQLALETLLRNQ